MKSKIFKQHKKDLNSSQHNDDDDDDIEIDSSETGVASSKSNKMIIIVSSSILITVVVYFMFFSGKKNNTVEKLEEVATGESVANPSLSSVPAPKESIKDLPDTPKDGGVDVLEQPKRHNPTLPDITKNLSF